MQAFRTGLAAKLLSALTLVGGFCSLFAGDVRLDGGELWSAENRFLIRGVGYSPVGIGDKPCVYARDLPLIAALGANTVSTGWLLAEGDTTFVPLLETTRLRWLAGFPLEAYYDARRPITARREEILAAFRNYAQRFIAEPRLIAYVFGDGVVDNYNLKFAGPLSDFYTLLEEAAAVVQELEPESPPLLATGTENLAELRQSPTGLSFWLYHAGPARDLLTSIDQIRRTGAKPVLVDASEEPATAESTRQIEAEPFLLGGVHAAFADDPAGSQRLGIFQPVATGLEPRQVYQTLAGLWGGRTPADWRLEDQPRMLQVAHAASGADAVAPGALFRVTGEALESDELAANGIPWPFHLGETCLCIGGKPVPMGMVSAQTAVAQVPWDLAPGEHAAVLFRAGRATNSVQVQVAEYAPGIFPGGVVRAGTSCRASSQNGVRPDEILEVYASGLGPGAPSWVTPVAYINGTPAEVLYSGTLPTMVGMNQVNLRVNPLTPPAPSSFLELRVGEAASNLYPLGVSAADARFGITLKASSSELLLQAGGPGKVVEIQVEGANGYCGPVLLASAAAPSGVTFRAPLLYTGQNAPVEVRASAAAKAQSSAQMVLYGYAGGATSGLASIPVTVLPGQGDVKVRVTSGGYKAQSVARFDWNGRNLFTTAGGVPGRGINVLTVDAATGVFSGVASFDTWGDRAASDRLLRYLTELPAGTLVMFAVADEGTLQLTSMARDVIASMFGSRALRTLAYQQSWAMIARKGAASPIAEGASAASQVNLERVLTFPQP